MRRIYGARYAALGAVAAALTAITPRVSVAAAPDAATVRLASDEFDAGARAYKEKDFATAASHFEAADAAVPTPKTLRLAMRARAEAGQASRAATLAAQALARYPADDETRKLAEETIAAAKSKVHEVEVSCLSPCILAVETRAIPGEATTRWVVYLDPGKTTIRASFIGGATGGEQRVDAVAGGKSSVRFEPQKTAVTSTTPAEKPQKPEKPAETKPSDEAEPEPSLSTSGSGLPPLVFFIGAGLTVAAGGVSVWSGIDTQNNPGVDAVREACAGKGEDCPEYQDGISRQNRTNTLLIATAGLGVATIVIGTLFTNWDGDEKTDAKGFVAPTVAVTDDGAQLFASGRF